MGISTYTHSHMYIHNSKFLLIICVTLAAKLANLPVQTLSCADRQLKEFSHVPEIISNEGQSSDPKPPDFQPNFKTVDARIRSGWKFCT